jgi:hypothetical protein
MTGEFQVAISAVVVFMTAPGAAAASWLYSYAISKNTTDTVSPS